MYTKYIISKSVIHKHNNFTKSFKLSKFTHTTIRNRKDTLKISLYRNTWKIFLKIRFIMQNIYVKIFGIKGIWLNLKSIKYKCILYLFVADILQSIRYDGDAHVDEVARRDFKHLQHKRSVETKCEAKSHKKPMIPPASRTFSYLYRFLRRSWIPWWPAGDPRASREQCAGFPIRACSETARKRPKAFPSSALVSWPENNAITTNSTCAIHYAGQWKNLGYSRDGYRHSLRRVHSGAFDLQSHRVQGDSLDSLDHRPHKRPSTGYKKGLRIATSWLWKSFS